MCKEYNRSRIIADKPVIIRIMVDDKWQLENLKKLSGLSWMATQKFHCSGKHSISGILEKLNWNSYENLYFLLLV